MDMPWITDDQLARISKLAHGSGIDGGWIALPAADQQALRALMTAYGLQRARIGMLEEEVRRWRVKQ